MGVTLYDDDAEKGWKPDGGEGHISIGLGTSYTMPRSNNDKDMDNEVTAININPEGAYNFCGYEDKNLGGMMLIVKKQYYMIM